MTEVVYKARPMKWDAIAALAMQHRQMLGVQNREYLPVLDLVEKVLSQTLDMFEFLIGTGEEMGHNYGLTHPEGTFIMIREDHYIKACNDDPRSRWTLAHEWGHWALHSRQPLARASLGEPVQAFECPERQAHQFAAELLIPRHLIKGDRDVHSIMRRFGVSHEAATRRVDYLTRRGLLGN